MHYVQLPALRSVVWSNLQAPNFPLDTQQNQCAKEGVMLHLLDPCISDVFHSCQHARCSGSGPNGVCGTRVLFEIVLLKQTLQKGDVPARISRHFLSTPVQMGPHLEQADVSVVSP